jgi:hypothetical protein
LRSPRISARGVLANDRDFESPAWHGCPSDAMPGRGIHPDFATIRLMLAGGPLSLRRDSPNLTLDFWISRAWIRIV